jgi:hypothetical protein
MSSQGITDNTLGKGIDKLKILLLRKPVSKINPAQVFEKGRLILGTTDPDGGGFTTIISEKNGDGITQYADLQELFITLPSVIVTDANNGLGLSGNTVQLGGTLLKNTVISGQGTYYLSINNSIGAGFTDLTVFPGGLSWDNKVLFSPNYYESKITNTDPRTFLISVAKLNSTGTSTLGTIQVGLTTTGGITFTDTLLQSGASYFDDYSTNGIANFGDRWIPDKGYVDSKSAPTIYFQPGTFTGDGQDIGIGTPFAVNAGNGLTGGDPTYGVVLGGTLIKNSTITNNAFTLSFDRAGNNINFLNFKNTSTTEAQISAGGYFRGGGITAITGSQDAEVLTSTSGTLVARSQNDASTALKVAQLGNTATGDILQLLNYGYSVIRVKNDGGVIHRPIAQAVAGVGIAYSITGGLKPTANNDTLIALDVNSSFSSGGTILTYTGLTGGSGYIDGTRNGTVTGGSGIQAVVVATISGGVITGLSIVDGGIGYQFGDVLSIVITDPITGVPTGSGATITVNTVTSYTGIKQIAARFNNAPIQLGSVSTPTNFNNGMVWFDGTHFYARIAGVSYQIDQQSGGGGGGTTTNPITFNSSGSGAASGTTFDGSVARTISYNTIGAQVAGSYLTGNQSITLSGDISGTGATAITTAIGAGKVTNTMLAGSITASKLVSTDITTVGTITAGVWNGTAIANVNLANSTISGVALGSNLAALTATNASLTFSGSYDGSTARTVGLNLGNANTWTGIQTLNSSGSIASGIYNAVPILLNINNSGSGGYRGIYGSVFEQANGSGIKYLIDLGTNSATNGSGTHTSFFSVTNAGIIQFGNSSNSATLTSNASGGGGFGSIAFGSVNAGSMFIASAYGIDIGGGAAVSPVSTDARLNTRGQGSTTALNWNFRTSGGTSVFKGNDAGLWSLGNTAGTAYQIPIVNSGGTAMVWASPLTKPHTIFTPTTGGTVSLTNNQYNIINPSGALVTLTVNLPSSPANNDCVFIKYTQNITTVTYGNGTVVDGITAPSAGGLVVLVYDSGTTSWY